MITIGRRVISGCPAIGLVTPNYCHPLISLFNTVIIDPHSFSQFWIFLSGNMLHAGFGYLCTFAAFTSLKPTIPCALVTLQYFPFKICNDPSNENVVNLRLDKIVGFFTSTNMDKWDCDNKSLECLYWTSRKESTAQYTLSNISENSVQWNICTMIYMKRRGT